MNYRLPIDTGLFLRNFFRSSHVVVITFASGVCSDIITIINVHVRYNYIKYLTNIFVKIIINIVVNYKKMKSELLAGFLVQ